MTSQMKKVFGTSFVSLLLVVIGLFVVCSGSMQDISLEDEFMEEDFLDDEFLSDGEFGDEMDESYKDELLGKLDVIEEDGTMSSQGDESVDFLSDLTDETRDPAAGDDSFLTPELFNSMESEVRELSEISTNKDRVIDSLRTRLSATNSELSSLESKSQSTRASTRFVVGGVNDAKVYDSEFGMYYLDALDDFYVRKYDRAIRKFGSLISQGGSSELLDNCQYWIGEAYYAKGNYYQAIAEFQQVLAWGNSNKANDAQLMIGLAFMKLGETDLAREEFNTLVTFSSDSQSAQKARKYLQELDRV